jgi:RHS repeat-associated protein
MWASRRDSSIQTTIAEVCALLINHFSFGWVVFDDVQLIIVVTMQATIRCSIYSLAMQTIAIRVSGDPVSGNNGLFFYYGDHLGSTSIMLRSNGDFVSGSTARYHPFGGWRTTPNQTITDRGFTGHAHNNTGANDLGLVYMGARFYLPGVGRFLSADTIVPDPMNPQQFNRYTYVVNNPLRYSDPTGHYCYDPSSGPDLVGTCIHADGTTYSLPTPPPQVTQLWIDPQSVTAIQLYGNTNFAFNLDGTGPSYAYSQGFHGGLDLLAEPGTEVVAGIHGRVAWVSDWTAYKPRYIVIEIAPNTYIIIGHLSADNPSNLKAGQVVTPDTVVGTLESTERHAHIEFWTGTGSNITNRTIEVPYQYMSPQVRRQFAALQQNMAQDDIRITFHRRADGLWSSMYDQPSLIYGGPNLNMD